MEAVLNILFILFAAAAIVGSIACMLMALSDLERNRQLRGWARIFWILFILLSPIAGAVLYYMIVKPEGGAALKNS